MKTHFLKIFTLKFLLLTLFAAVFASCAANQTEVNPTQIQESENWELFVEVDKGQYQMLIDTLSISRIGNASDERSFKCSVKVGPSPKRAKSLGVAIKEGNLEAGVASDNDEKFIKGIIESETSLFPDSQISCKDEKLYFYNKEKRIAEFPVSVNGTDRDFLNKVCK